MLKQFTVSELSFDFNEESFESIVQNQIIQRNQSLFGDNVIPPDESQYSFWVYIQYSKTEHSKKMKLSERAMRDMEDSIVDSLLISDGAFVAQSKPNAKNLVKNQLKEK